jgi:hypothetical protein
VAEPGRGQSRLGGVSADRKVLWLSGRYNIELSPGPAFVWWQLTIGAVITTLGAASLVGTRLARVGLLRGLLVIRLLLLALVLIGAAAIVRSFRTA